MFTCWKNSCVERVKMKMVWILNVKDRQTRKCLCYTSWRSKSFTDENHQTHNIHLPPSLEMHLCQFFVSLLPKHKAVKRFTKLRNFLPLWIFPSSLSTRLPLRLGPAAILQQ